MENIVSGQSFEGKMSKEEFERRREKAEYHYEMFLMELGYDVDNDSALKETPKRMVKIMLDELCKGTYQPLPKITSFPNDGKYDGIVFQGNIEVRSLCAHHFCPILGKAHVAYIPCKTIIGLSKLNRIVSHFANRPQTQEQLTMQIHDKLSEILEENLGVAVFIEAMHTCVTVRGVQEESTMKTCKLSGVFRDQTNKSREEFYRMIADLKK